MSAFTQAARESGSGSGDRIRLTSVGVLLLWIGLMTLGAAGGYWKLVAISLIAWAAMMAGAAGARWAPAVGRSMLWADGLAAGAMITSASLFLLPMAMTADAVGGGLGVAAGLIAGAALQTAARAAGRHASTLEPSTAALCLHALCAGLVIGAVYGRMPGIGVLLGTAIVSHKLPAGYAAARNLQRRGQSIAAVLLPACAVGLTSLPTGMLVAPGEPGHGAAVFGFATGIFIHVAVAFMSPPTEAGRGGWRLSLAAVAGGLLVVALRHLAA